MDKPYLTILSGDETLAADIHRNPADPERFIVRCIDEECRRDAGIDAVVQTHYDVDIDRAIRLANAWVTQTPAESLPYAGKPDSCQGCGRVEPMGVHYSDCTLLEPGDITVEREADGPRHDCSSIGGAHDADCQLAIARGSVLSQPGDFR